MKIWQCILVFVLGSSRLQAHDSFEALVQTQGSFHHYLWALCHPWLEILASWPGLWCLGILNGLALWSLCRLWQQHVRAVSVR